MVDNDDSEQSKDGSNCSLGCEKDNCAYWDKQNEEDSENHSKYFLSFFVHNRRMNAREKKTRNNSSDMTCYIDTSIHIGWSKQENK